jgi:hypothetical protein
MKYILPIIIVAVTAILVALSVTGAGGSAKTVGIASGSALPGFTPKAGTPEQAVANLLIDVQRRNWDRAYAGLAKTDNRANAASFKRDWTGTDGSLRTFSSLEAYDARPLHATADEAQMRLQLRWTTPVGPIQEVRDVQVKREGDAWKVVWPQVNFPSVPAQVIPVNYLRWDLVSGGADDEWGSKSVDAPHVRIISMNAVDSADGSIVMGEVVNEDTIPAFVNVNATLVDGSGNAIDDESSFDKIAHVLLPKQVSPYRIDFPNVPLNKVKNVRMDVKATLVPASADPVIGAMDQKIETDPQGRSVLHGQLLNQSGQTVNISHVIASFYDNSGKVVWVSDGYVDRALLPQAAEPFAVEIPKALSGKVQNFHVVVNQFSLGKS